MACKNSCRISFRCVFGLYALTMSACSIINVNENEKISSLYLKAEKAYFSKRYLLAANYYNDVLRHKPDNVDVLFRLGNINMYERKWGDAREYYNRVLAIQPGHEKSRYNIVILHLYQAKKHMLYYTSNFDAVRNSAMNDLIKEIDNYSVTSNVSPSSSTNKSDYKTE